MSGSIIDHLTPFIRGLLDGVNVFSTIKLILRSSRIKQFLKESLPLYLSWMFINFIYSFWYCNYVGSSYGSTSTLNRIFIKALWWGLWFVPSYVICKVLYFKHFMELWELIYKKKRKLSAPVNPWRFVSELLYGIILICGFMLQNIIIDYMLPLKFAGVMYSIIANSWMISWGVFEYKLVYENKDLFQRIYYFECRWLYFLGFGLPCSLLYALIFDWFVGMNAWYLIMIILSFNAILTEPVETFVVKEDKSGVNEVCERRFPNRRPSDPRRLRIFYISEYLATYVIKLIIDKRNKLM